MKPLAVRIAYAFALVALVGCPHSPPSTKGAPPSASALVTTRALAETAYGGALGTGWQDQGWSPRDLGHGPASLDLSNSGGWILAKPGLTGSFGGLSLRVKAPTGEAEFLEVRLESTAALTFPRVKVGADQKSDVGNGWFEVFVPMGELNPTAAPFDRVVLRAFREIPSERVLIDQVGLVAGSGAVGPDAGPGASGPTAAAQMRVECNKRGRKISPLVYGIAWETDGKHDAFSLGATARRWGGNPTSRYNRELSAWNTANDWFFENVKVRSHATFLEENRAHGFASALTVPMLGWVAKDETSNGFPVSASGPQQKADEWRKDAGNGNGPDGKALAAGPPTRTSVPAPPEFVTRWLEDEKAAALAKGNKPIDIAILDNEPGLWNSTHRDVHPDPLTYDELVERSVRYATAIRKADANVRIAGPAEWGWLGYMYSAKDAAVGVRLKPDRRAHGDEALAPYYLRKMAEAGKASGQRLLDLFDLHFYPQGDKVFSDTVDSKTAALRVRQTRGLWDKAYVDESWIGEPIYLLPRMRAWIDSAAPGANIMVGEWSFGGEQHMSGALADAEALGRFAEYDVEAAFYWTVPPNDSPAAHAFRAYRDFDGKGGRFLDYFVPASSSPGASVFASRDASGSRLVLVALNFSPDAAMSAQIDLAGASEVRTVSARTYSGGVGFRPAEAKPSGAAVKATLAPYSITVLDVALTTPLAAGVDE